MKILILFCMCTPLLWAHETIIRVHLNGAQQTHEANTDAEGYGIVTINEDHTEMSVYITHTVSNPTAGHIHMAAAGEDGPVIFPFDSPQSPIEQTFSIDEEDFNTFTNGMFYFNIHSAAIPAGEIRGQLRLTSPLAVGIPSIYKVSLRGDNQVPPISSPNWGNAQLVLNADHTELTVQVVHSIPDPIAGHLHLGPAEDNGPVVLPFDNFESPIHQTFAITPELTAELEAGNLYVNLHSETFPSGDLRGQVDNGVLGYHFEVEVTNLTKAQIFSPPIAVAHHKDTSLFTPGTPASEPLAIMAEDGNAFPLMAEALSNPGVGFVTVAPGPVMPGNTITMDMLTTRNGDRITVAGMLITTNDAFFAAEGLTPTRVEFLKNGTASTGTSRVMAPVYDAGSEANNEDCGFMPGPPCGNGGVRATEGAEGRIYFHSGVHGIGDIDPATWTWNGPAAMVTLRRK